MFALTSLVFAAFVPLAPAAGPQQCAPDRVSELPGGVDGNDSSGDPAASADGRFVSFTSRATNFAGWTGFFFQQVFVADRVGGTLERISVDLAGDEGNGHSTQAKISADGRYVAFLSTANDLVAGDTNGKSDAFVRDRATGTTVRATLSSSGAEPNASCGFMDLSASGGHVAFWSTADNLVPGDHNGEDDVFVRDLTAGTTELVSIGLGGAPADGPSAAPTLSADGRYVAFHSRATNLVAGDTNGLQDVFLRDRVAGTTVLVSVRLGAGVPLAGAIGPEISDDGSVVAFWSGSGDFVPGDTNLATDVFVRDLVTSSTERVSVASDGSQVSGDSNVGFVSSDGRYVAFSSEAFGLDPADQNSLWDAYVHDRVTGRTRLVTLSPTGFPGDGDSWATSEPSADGRRVPVDSQASNMVDGDDNERSDAFLFDCTALSVATYCTAKVNSKLCLPAIEGVGFASATDPAPFLVRATRVLNQRPGLLFYGLTPDTKPFQGGFKCVDSPVRRFPVQDSGGNPPPADCSGTYAVDLNAWIRSGADATLVAGAVVHCQFWSRDAGSASGTGLTDALMATILP
jgi:Tol biopolymer transport system component